MDEELTRSLYCLTLGVIWNKIVHVRWIMTTENPYCVSQWMCLCKGSCACDLRLMQRRTRTRERRGREMEAGRRRQRTGLIVYWGAVDVGVFVCVDVHVWSMAPLWPCLRCYRQTSPQTHTLACSERQCCRHVRVLIAQLFFCAIRHKLFFEDNM